MFGDAPFKTHTHKKALPSAKTRESITQIIRLLIGVLMKQLDILLFAGIEHTVCYTEVQTQIL